MQSQGLQPGRVDSREGEGKPSVDLLLAIEHRLQSLDRVVHIVQILRDQIRVLGSLSPA